MITNVYRWIGLGVGTIGALFGFGALVQELRPPIDFSTVAFDLVFGLIMGGIAAGCGHDLLRAQRREVSGGCLIIVLVTGGMVLLTGALLFALSIDSEEPPPPAMIGISLAVGAILVIPSGVLLLRRLRR